jgi:hypothetical protein
MWSFYSFIKKIFLYIFGCQEDNKKPEPEPLKIDFKDPEQRKAYNKEYYEKSKGKRTVCETCGKSYNTEQREKHFQSRKHLKNI